MKHLEEMCCDPCREKVLAIQARALSSPVPLIPTGYTTDNSMQAFADRHDLLVMLEHLLCRAAVDRERLQSAKVLLERADAVMQKADAMLADHEVLFLNLLKARQ